MDYCGPLGIPHSTFLGWSEDDQQKALWWKARNRQVCAGCGTHPDDWNEDLGGSRNAYVPEEVTCPGCRARAGAEEQLQAERKNNPTGKHGTYIVLVRPSHDEHDQHGGR